MGVEMNTEVMCKAENGDYPVNEGSDGFLCLVWVITYELGPLHYICIICFTF